MNNVIKLEGYEFDKEDRSQNRKFIFREWHLRYLLGSVWGMRPYNLTIGETKIGIGHLDVSKAGEASFFKNKELVASLYSTRLAYHAQAVMKLEGYELTGHDRTGRPKYRLQEWFLAFIED